MTFLETIEALEKRGVMPDRAPSLQKMTDALELCQLTPDPKKVILIAGTNGKGSTSAALESLLRHSGERTGFYSSPHLVHYCERIRIDSEPISEKLFCDAYEQLAATTKELSLSHFEMLTLMAVWVFLKERVDWLILEVGLGGTWDATNAVTHETALITALDYDHQNLLGTTLPEIAKNKLGIVTGECRTVVHQKFPEIISSLVEKTKSENPGVQWIESTTYPLEVIKGQPPQFSLRVKQKKAPFTLAGARGAENVSLALTTFANLGFPIEPHLEALSQISWPGRMDLVGYTSKETPVYLSGDHNPQGIRSLVSLLEYYPREKIYAVVGIGKDKDRDGILSELFKINEVQVAITPTPFRGLKLSEYGHWLETAAASFEDSKEAFTWASRNTTKNDMIVVTGSLYLVGEIKALFNDGFYSEIGRK